MIYGNKTDIIPFSAILPSFIAFMLEEFRLVVCLGDPS